MHKIEREKRDGMKTQFSEKKDTIFNGINE